MDPPADTVKEEKKTEEMIKNYEEEEVIDEEEEEEDGPEEEKELVLDLEILRDGFTPGADGEIPLASYVKAFYEMNKFIKMMGPLFHFVAFDIKRKLSVLRKELAGEKGEHYVDARTMIKYEKEHDIVLRSSPQSGSEALLMLHHGMEFARDFMKEIMKEEEEPSLGRASSELYLATVGRFHPSILARTFSGVLLLMPDRATIRSRIAKGSEEAEETLRRLMPGVIQSVTDTYDACQTLYTYHDLHHL